MNNSSETNKKNKKLISIITPFFNDEEVVEDFHDSLSEIINKLPDYAFEMICIDDGSSDQTLSELLKKAEKNEIYHLIELSRNFGKEAALTAGLDRSNGEAAIILDSDLQDPPELIFKLLEEWEKGADVVLPKRKVVNADKFFKNTPFSTDFFNELKEVRDEYDMYDEYDDCDCDKYGDNATGEDAGSYQTQCGNYGAYWDAGNISDVLIYNNINIF